MFVKVLGEENNDFNFGYLVFLNECILVVVFGEGKNFCIFVYVVEFFSLFMIVCIFEFKNIIGFLFVWFMKIDVFVMVLKNLRLFKVFQFNVILKFYNEVCYFEVVLDEYLSGNFDVNV